MKIILYTLILLLSANIYAQGGGFRGPDPSEANKNEIDVDKLNFNKSKKKLARPEFFELFELTNSSLNDSNFEAARTAIDKMTALSDKNAFEDAHIALVNYRYYELTNDTINSMPALVKVVNLGAKHIESSIYTTAGMNLFRYQVENRQYGEANETVSHMRNNKSAKKQLKKVKSIVKKVNAIVESDTAIVQQANVNKTGVWQRKLIRPSLFLEEVNGEVKKFGFRCEHKNAAVAYEEKSSLNIPKEWGTCTVKVYATEGTTFNLVQFI